MGRDFENSFQDVLIYQTLLSKILDITINDFRQVGSVVKTGRLYEKI